MRTQSPWNVLLPMLPTCNLEPGTRVVLIASITGEIIDRGIYCDSDVGDGVWVRPIRPPRRSAVLFRDGILQRWNRVWVRVDLDTDNGMGHALRWYSRKIGHALNSRADHGIDRVLVNRYWSGETTPADRILLAAAIADLLTPPIPLCADCAGAIGGAGAGPDVPWRHAEPGESCAADDHAEGV